MSSITYLDKTGLETYHAATIASVSKSISNGTASGGTKALMGGEYVSKVTPDDGYYISAITVTIDGTDITSQVFEGVEVGTDSSYVTASEVSTMITNALTEYGDGDTVTYG